MKTRNFMIAAATMALAVSAFAITQDIRFAGKENGTDLPFCDGKAYVNNGGDRDQINVIVESRLCDDLDVTAINGSSYRGRTSIKLSRTRNGGFKGSLTLSKREAPSWGEINRISLKLTNGRKYDKINVIAAKDFYTGRTAVVDPYSGLGTRSGGAQEPSSTVVVPSSGTGGGSY